jgi:hypothetical protein
MFGKSAVEVKEDFRSFYFDLALFSSEAVLRMVLDLVPHDHILYGMLLDIPCCGCYWLFLLLTPRVGSDYPYAPTDVIVGSKQILDDFPLDQELREKIYYKNVDALLAKRDC